MFGPAAWRPQRREGILTLWQSAGGCRLEHAKKAGPPAFRPQRTREPARGALQPCRLAGRCSGRVPALPYPPAGSRSLAFEPWREKRDLHLVACRVLLHYILCLAGQGLVCYGRRGRVVARRPWSTRSMQGDSRIWPVRDSPRQGGHGRPDDPPAEFSRMDATGPGPRYSGVNSPGREAGKNMRTQ